MKYGDIFRKQHAFSIENGLQYTKMLPGTPHNLLCDCGTLLHLSYDQLPPSQKQGHTVGMQIQFSPPLAR